jgi:lipooligosaccharide transport system permease protein
MFLFITPMFLFSGTFFPVSNLPVWARPFAMAFPLHHLVELFRTFCAGAHETPLWISLIYLPLFLLVFGLLALVMMKRRLIK